MPTYEYSCEKCGPFEIWQSIKDNALGVCPTCGSKVQRLISANVGFVFKGSGFYQNEYKNHPKAPEPASIPAKEVTKPQGKAASGPDSSPVKAEMKPQGDSAPGCGACGSPDPCSSGNN
jgi:putative FmdB family regulatory protein